MDSLPEFTIAELRGALAPVAEYHTDRSPSANSVLAAWLRSASVSPNGKAWLVAKTQLAASQSFGSSAIASFRLATKAALAEQRPEAVHDAPRRAAGESRVTADPRRAKPSAWSRFLGEAKPSASPVPRSEEPGLRVSEHYSPMSGDAPAQGRRLERFSKPFGPGDMDGSGSKALLGRPSLEQSAVLVRETAQNSWDARVSKLVRFEVRLSRATPEVRRVLRRVVFADSASPQSLPLSSVMDEQDLWLLEILDRGTRGLEGPTRNDLVSAPGVRTDYADFVLTLGAPRDKELGGGTYGFGKTISYTCTKSATLVIWTRCREQGEYQHRLIASAFGTGYSESGVKYTGRHWWGRVHGQRVEPVVGQEARGLGEDLYTKGFDGDETGTSLLLIAPDFGEISDSTGVRSRTPREYAQALSDAAMTNLWPKLVGEDDRDSMEIKVFFEEEDLSPGRVDEDPVLGAFATSLRIVRSIQGGVEPFVGAFSEHWEIVDGRGRGKLLGHCAATRYLMTPEVLERLKRLFPDDEAPEGRHLCLMRHDAELVVRYREGRGSAQKEYGWAGVFKPIAPMDDAFADAEPPSHDDWLPQSVRDPKHKSPVNIALNQTKKKLDDWASPRLKVEPNPDLGMGAAALAEALGDLMSGIPGGTPVKKSSRVKGRTAPAKKHKATIGRALQAPHSIDGFVQWEVEVTVEGNAPMQVKVRPAIATAAGPEANPELCEVVGWRGPDGQTISSNDTAELCPGELSTVLVKAPAGLALDVRLQGVQS